MSLCAKNDLNKEIDPYRLTVVREGNAVTYRFSESMISKKQIFDTLWGIGVRPKTNVVILLKQTVLDKETQIKVEEHFNSLGLFEDSSIYLPLSSIYNTIVEVKTGLFARKNQDTLNIDENAKVEDLEEMIEYDIVNDINFVVK